MKIIAIVSGLASFSLILFYLIVAGGSSTEVVSSMHSTIIYSSMIMLMLFSFTTAISVSSTLKLRNSKLVKTSIRKHLLQVALIVGVMAIWFLFVAAVGLALA